jgi:hypothetical protein
MARSLAPRPRRLSRRGRSSAGSEQELKNFVSARVLALLDCTYRELGEQWRAVWRSEPPRKASREFLFAPWPMGFKRRRSVGLTQRRSSYCRTLILRTVRDPSRKEIGLPKATSCGAFAASRERAEKPATRWLSGRDSNFDTQRCPLFERDPDCTARQPHGR